MPQEGEKEIHFEPDFELPIPEYMMINDFS